MALITSKLIELCVFKVQYHQPYYLLLHRTKDEKIYPNIWQFITGSIEANEKAVDAALREFAEETGLKPTSFWVVPYVFSFYDAEWNSMNLCPFFAAEVQDGEKIKLSNEHDEYGWFAFEEAFQKLIWPSWQEGLRIVNEFITKGGEAAKLSRIF